MAESLDVEIEKLFASVYSLIESFQGIDSEIKSRLLKYYSDYDVALNNIIASDMYAVVETQNKSARTVVVDDSALVLKSLPVILPERYFSERQSILNSSQEMLEKAGPFSAQSICATNLAIINKLDSLFQTFTLLCQEKYVFSITVKQAFFVAVIDYQTDDNCTPIQFLLSKVRNQISFTYAQVLTFRRDLISIIGHGLPIDDIDRVLNDLKRVDSSYCVTQEVPVVTAPNLLYSGTVEGLKI